MTRQKRLESVFRWAFEWRIFSRVLPPPMVREDSAEWPDCELTERHLRAVWYDPFWRPPLLTTAEGERLEVEDPGRWNVEAGPDFLDASLRVGPTGRRLVGDVELHLRPQDWLTHGHRTDPRYRRVIAHVTYHPGVLAGGILPPGAIQVSLGTALKANPAFAAESIDLAAYPYALREEVTPCARELMKTAPEGIASILALAGEERLRRKSLRLIAGLRGNDPEQILYEECMAALGYKQNRVPFRLLAARVPLVTLREESQGDPQAALALLCGVAGLLPREAPLTDDKETLLIMRCLWDWWWKRAEHWRQRYLPSGSWTLSGIRPANHPVRRLAAAAHLFVPENRPAALLRGAVTDDPHQWVEAMLDGLQAAGQADEFWRTHYSFSGARSPKPSALLGAERAGSILVNVLIPWQAAQVGQAPAWPKGMLDVLPADTVSRLERQAAYNLLGHDHNPDLYRDGLRRQGLLHIFLEYCLNDRTGCRECLLPAALKEQR